MAEYLFFVGTSITQNQKFEISFPFQIIFVNMSRNTCRGVLLSFQPLSFHSIQPWFFLEEIRKMSLKMSEKPPDMV